VCLILLLLIGLLLITCRVIKFCFTILYKWDIDDPIWDLFFKILFYKVKEVLIIIITYTLSLKQPV